MNEQLTPIALDADDDKDSAHYAFEGQGRLVLETIHGTVIIDIRHDDVNAFSLHNRGQTSRDDDKLLIPPP